jgi:hypothetical protein
MLINTYTEKLYQFSLQDSLKKSSKGHVPTIIWVQGHFWHINCGHASTPSPMLAPPVKYWSLLIHLRPLREGPFGP